MPDEYDSIEDSLAPFRAFTHEDLKERIAIAAKIPNTFQITVKDGQTSAEVGSGICALSGDGR
jgi:L-serine deaminase